MTNIDPAIVDALRDATWYDDRPVGVVNASQAERIIADAVKAAESEGFKRGLKGAGYDCPDCPDSCPICAFRIERDAARAEMAAGVLRRFREIHKGADMTDGGPRHVYIDPAQMGEFVTWLEGEATP